MNAYTSRLNGARKCEAAGVCRGNLHPDIVTIDEGDVVGDASRNRPLPKRDMTVLRISCAGSLSSDA